MHIVAGLHFGKQSSPQYYESVQAEPPTPLPALPHKTAWLLIGLQVHCLTSMPVVLCIPSHYWLVKRQYTDRCMSSLLGMTP